VEIDESLLVKRKYNRGRMLKEQWVFGGVVRGTRTCFFEIVADRTEATLLEVIKRRIKAGTTIMSDRFRSYCNLSRHGYVHFTVNHSEHFVDPETGAHTQTIEATWGSLKQFLKGKGRNIGPHLEEYMAEFVYRRAQGDTLFDKILEDIVRFHPPL